MIFLSLPSVELAMERVRARVVQGGHSVADDVVRRRFDAGLWNFENVYRELVDSWTLYDNSGNTPMLITKAGN
jgi:predicted ABC-type ATPase